MDKSSNSNGEPDISLDSLQKITKLKKRLGAQNNVHNVAGSSNIPEVSNVPEVSSVRQRLSHHGKDSQIPKSRSQSNIVQPKSQSSQPSRRAIASLLFFQQILAFIISLLMTTWDTIDRIQTAKTALLETYIGGFALSRRLRASFLGRLVTKLMLLAIAAIVALYSLDVLTGAVVSSGELVLQSVVNKSCSKPILGALLPLVGVDCSNAGATTASYISNHHITDLQEQQDLLGAAVNATLQFIPMSSSFVLGELWIRKAANDIENSDLKMRAELAAAHRVYAKSIYSTSKALHMFISNIERMLDLTAYNLSYTVRSIRILNSWWSLLSWSPFFQARVLQEYIEYIEYLEKEVVKVIWLGQVSINDMELLQVHWETMDSMRASSEHDVQQGLQLVWNKIPWAPWASGLHQQQGVLIHIHKLHQPAYKLMSQLLVQLPQVQEGLKNLRDDAGKAKPGSANEIVKHLGQLMMGIRNFEGDSKSIRDARHEENRRIMQELQGGLVVDTFLRKD